MRRILAVLLAVAAIYFAYNFFSGPEITNYPSRNTGLVAFGDSLVQGAGSSQGGGFVKMLEKELEIKITNLGRSGDTTAVALARVDEVINRKPAVTIVLLGGNDFLRGVPRAETFENLSEIIEAIHASGSTVLLLGLGSDLKNLAEQYKTAYVGDILDGIYGRPKMMSDSLHPNDAGYKLMAERIEPLLLRLTVRP